MFGSYAFGAAMLASLPKYTTTPPPVTGTKGYSKASDAAANGAKASDA